MEKIRFIPVILTMIFLLCACADSRTAPDTDAQTVSQTDTTQQVTTSTTQKIILTAEPIADSELVRVSDHIPDILTDIRYASANNFTGKQIYDFNNAYLRYGTVKKLAQVQQTLAVQGFRLLIWDAYRPHSAQFALWEIVSDPTYVSDPNKKYSSHSNGGTVDITIVLADGSFVEMPSDFDEFTSSADRDYSDVSDEAERNAMILQNAMTSCGFSGYFGEWWHYSDTDEYEFSDIEKIRLPKGSERLYYANCDEYINLRTVPFYDAPSICRIPAGETMTAIGWTGSFVRVKYGETQGYVAADYIEQC